MFETILVPLDGSELAEEALETAAELASGLGARLVLVQAVDSLAHRMTQPIGILDSPAGAAANVELLQKALDAEKEGAQRYLAEHRTKLTAKGNQVEAFVGEGGASEVILGLAKDQNAGMIVMSTHGRGGLSRLLFGSVAEAVLRHGEVPVLLLRSKAKA